MAHAFRQPVDEPEGDALIEMLEARIEARVVELEQAEAEGRLAEAIGDIPSVWDQARSVPESHFYEPDN